MNPAASGTGVVFAKEVREHLGRGHAKFGLILLVAMWLFNVAVVGRTIAASMGRPGMELLLDSLVTHQSLAFFFIATFMIMTALFKQEKLTGALESLMATPLDLTAIWLGKALMMWAAGLAFSFLAIVLAYAELLVMFVRPAPPVVPAPPAVVFFLVVFPALTFALSLLFGLLQLAFPRSWIGGSINLLLGFGYLTLTSAKMKSMTLTWTSIAAYVAATAVVLVIVAALKPRLTAERVLASGSR